MTDVWPASLPQNALIEGYEEEEPDDVLRTDMEVGPAKTRLRSTASPYNITWPLILTTAQRATLRTFYRTTLRFGTLKFMHIHPITGDAITCRFIKPPSYTPVSFDRFKVTLQIEVLP